MSNNAPTDEEFQRLIDAAGSDEQSLCRLLELLELIISSRNQTPDQKSSAAS